MATRDIRWQVYIDWNGDGSYTEESSNLITATGNYRVNAPGTPTISGGGIISQCTLILNNASSRYSVNNPASFVFLNGGSYGKYHHRPMYLNISIDGGSNYYRVFSGVIAEINEVAPTPTEAATVSIDCRDYSELYLNTRSTTATSAMVALYEDGATEADVIEQFMTDAFTLVSVGHDATHLTLDNGTFVIPWAWMDDESPIEECWNVAAACGGWFYADVWDTTQPAWVYRNAQHWAKATVSTSAPDNELRRVNGDYQGLQIKYDHTELFKEVTVEWSSRKPGNEDVIWEPEEPIIVPANDTKTVTATFRTPVYSISALDYSAATSGGLDISSAVSDDIASATPYAQRVTVTFTNAHATYAAVLKNVTMTGKPIEGGPDGEVTSTSVNSHWTGRVTKKRALRSNLWTQTETHADVLSQMLMDVHEAPVAVYTISGVKGDPRRKLGQKMRVYDVPTMDTANELMYIVGLDFVLSGSGFYQNVLAMDSESIGYAYVESSPGYFVLGTNRISITSGDAGSNRGRLFY